MKENAWKTKGVDWKECENSLHHVYSLRRFPLVVEKIVINIAIRRM